MTELGSLHGSRIEPLVSRCNEAGALPLQGLRQGSEGSAAAGCSEHEIGGITDQAGLRWIAATPRLAPSAIEKVSAWQRYCQTMGIV